MPPTTKIRKRRICLEPFACKCLYCLYVLSQRGGRRERDEDMHMVGHTADTIYFPVQVVGLLHDDGIEFPFMLGRDGLLALIGAENNMIYGLYVTHGIIMNLSLKSDDGLSGDFPACAFARGCAFFLGDDVARLNGRVSADFTCGLDELRHADHRRGNGVGRVEEDERAVLSVALPLLQFSFGGHPSQKQFARLRRGACSGYKVRSHDEAASRDLRRRWHSYIAFRRVA